MSQEHRHNLRTEPRHIRLVVPTGATKDTVCSFCTNALTDVDKGNYMLRGTYKLGKQPARICRDCLKAATEIIGEEDA